VVFLFSIIIDKLIKPLLSNEKLLAGIYRKLARSFNPLSTDGSPSSPLDCDLSFYFPFRLDDAANLRIPTTSE
jgi:hypothetical protein